MDWLLQNLLSNWLSALIVFVGGLVPAYFRARHPKTIPAIMCALGGMSLILFMLVCVRLWQWIPSPVQPIGPNNVQSSVRTWLDRFGMSTQVEQAENVHFRIVATMRTGTKINIIRQKGDLDRYLILPTRLAISPGHSEVIAKWTDSRKRDLMVALSSELARLKVNYTIALSDSMIVVERRVPITSNLTEDVFMERIDEVDAATAIANNTVTTRVEAVN